MRPLTDEETKIFFEKLSKYIGDNIKLLIDREDGLYCFRLHRDRVYYVSEKIMKQASNVARDNLISLGTCFGKFTKTRKFRLHITALDFLAPYSQHKIWVKPGAEQQFLYGHHVMKSGLGRITENTPKYQGVIVYSMNDLPLGFGVAAKATSECRHADPMNIVTFHQADIGEYIRAEETLLNMSSEDKVASERWAALEANPEVMTKLCHQVGVSPMFEVVDVWGLDPDMLGFVPQPVVSLILLFPSKSRDDENRRVTVPDHELSSKVYYLTQLKGHLDNACGTIAMLHSIINNRDILGVSGNSECVAEKFYKATIDKDHDERGRTLDTYQDIVDIHNKLVSQGQSSVLESDKVAHHFVCLTAVEGHLVELDGAYNSGPNIIEKVDESQGFLATAAKFVKEKYMSNAGDNAHFALMALVMSQGD